MPRRAVPRDRAIMAFVGALLLASFAYFHPGTGPNQNSRHDTIRAIVEEGTIAIDAYHENTIDKAVRGEHFYSDKAPGAALAGLPAYAAGYAVARAFAPAPHVRTDPAVQERLFWLTELVAAGVPGAALGVLVAAYLLRALGAAARPGVVAATALAIGLGTPIFAYATMLYGHTLSALALFAIFDALFRPEPLARRHLLVAGLATGVATLSEYTAAPAALILVAARFAPTSRAALRGLGARLPDLAWIALGGVPCALVFFAHNALVTGSPWHLPYSATQPALQQYFEQGTFGFGFSLPDPAVFMRLLVGAQRGLFLMSPVLLVALFGVRRFARHDRRAAVGSLAVIAYFLLLNSSYVAWWGGASTYARYLSAAVPFFAPFLYFALSAKGPVLRWGAAAAAVVSVANAVAIVAVHPQAQRRYLFPLGFCWEQIAKGEPGVAFWRAPALNRVEAYVSAADNLGARLTGANSAASLVPLLVLWAVAIAVGRAWLRRQAGAAAPSR